MAELILDVTKHPLVLAVLILLSTYLLEDAAIISGECNLNCVNACR